MTALEKTFMVEAFRSSTWAYPFINAGHILGLALLVGSTVPLVLRLIGAWKSVPVYPLGQVLILIAGVGLLLAVVCGILLFTSRATRYVQSGLFISIIAVVVAGAVYYFFLHKKLRNEWFQMNTAIGELSSRTGFTALLLLISSPAALILGRLVGYLRNSCLSISG